MDEVIQSTLFYKTIGPTDTRFFAMFQIVFKIHRNKKFLVSPDS